MRKVYVYLLVSLTVILGINNICFSQLKDNKPQNAILIGWDGVGRDNIKSLLREGKLPNLKQISQEGSLVAIDINRTTDTSAGWAQILTGYEPEVTGVYSNKRYKPIPEGYTIFERLKNLFGRKFITVALISKKVNMGDNPPLKEHLKWFQKKNEVAQVEKDIVIIEKGVEYFFIPAGPYYYTKKGMNVFINGLGDNGKVADKALALLEKYKDKPFFFFVHFEAPDFKGHEFGEDSKEYSQAIESSDYWTGKIIEKLKQLNLYGKTVVYITSDHGFDKGTRGHSNAPYVFLASNDPKIIRRGKRQDIAPTILRKFGVDLLKLSPSLDGHSLTEDYQEPKW